MQAEWRFEMLTYIQGPMLLKIQSFSLKKMKFDISISNLCEGLYQEHVENVWVKRIKIVGRIASVLKCSPP